MKKLKSPCLFLMLFLHLAFAYAQSKASIAYCPKFIKIQDEIYIVKAAKEEAKNARLFFANLSNHKIGWSSAHSGYLYPSFSWDIDESFFIAENNRKSGPQFEQHWREIKFLGKNEWLEENEYDTISRYVKRRLLEKKSSPIKKKTS